MISYRSLYVGALSASVLALIAGCGKSDESAADSSTETAETPAAEAGSLQSSEQIASYGIGYNVGANVHQGGIEIDEAAFLAGFRDAAAGNDPQKTSAELKVAFEAVQAKAQTAAKKAAEENAASAEKYLAENKEKPGVVTTESGLQYEVLESGDGAKPKLSDTVEVHYHGTLVDGKVFDSSVQRGETVSFPVTGVIPGWTEALQLMSVGDKWRLTIPPALGYGNRPAGQIPPGSVLNFEVELIDIK